MEAVFTDRELDIMGVLWDRGPSTVAQVRDHLKDPLAYTTVLSLLRTMEDKGHVAHVEEGRAFRYRAVVEKGDARVSALNRITRKLFGGSQEMLLSHLVSDHGLSEEEMERIKRLLEERLGGDE